MHPIEHLAKVFREAADKAMPPPPHAPDYVHIAFRASQVQVIAEALEAHWRSFLGAGHP